MSTVHVNIAQDNFKQNVWVSLYIVIGIYVSIFTTWKVASMEISEQAHKHAHWNFYLHNIWLASQFFIFIFLSLIV